MVQSLETYLKYGEPIQVISEEGFLVPYEIQKKDIIGGCSGLGPRTESTYRSYLVRIPGAPFNPIDFKKICQDNIIHLPVTWYAMEMVTLNPIIKLGLQRMFDEQNPAHDLTEIPDIKYDYSWETVNTIRCSCISDCIKLKQKTPWATKNTTALFEIVFNSTGKLGIDIYLRKSQ